MGKLKCQDSKTHTSNNPNTLKNDETENGIVAVQEPAEPEKPRVEPTPRSYGIIEMIAQASYEQEEFDGRITLAKAAKGLQLEPEEELGLDRLKLIQARRLERATPKEREEELAQDALAAEILEDSMKRKTEHDEAKAPIGREEQIAVIEFQEDIEKLGIIKARKNKMAKLKEMEAEREQDATAAKILEDPMKRETEHDEAKPAMELEEQVKLEDLDKARRLEEEQIDIDTDRLKIIQARRHKMAKIKEMEAECAQDAIAAKILEDFMKRKAEHDKTKAAGEPKETRGIEEKLEIQEEAKNGAPDEPESM